jgi:Protein of unknown function (DUF2812)
MFKGSSVKKVSKKFNDFAKEEQWLQNMLDDGWILKSYDSEDMDDCQYIFEPIQHNRQKNGTYKIDYRIFYKKDTFQEYNSIFEDAGWAPLAKNKEYFKHIFYTDAPHANRSIFSDTESYKEREKRKMVVAIFQLAGSIVVVIICFFLRNIYGEAAFMGAAFAALSLGGIPAIVAYYKHRKAYKSLIAPHN